LDFEGLQGFGLEGVAFLVLKVLPCWVFKPRYLAGLFGPTPLVAQCVLAAEDVARA